MDFEIVNIKKDHKEQIHRLIKEINREDKLNYSLTDEWLDYVIENAGGGIFLGFCGKELAGLGTAMINPVYGDQASLNIVVSPDYRRRGLGAILYDRVYSFVKEEGVSIVEAYVKERLAPSLLFALNRGFETAMYSWEMEILLDGIDFDLDKAPGISFRRAGSEDRASYKEIILDAFGDQVGEDSLDDLVRDSSILVYILEKENQAIGSASIQLRKDLSLAYIYDIAILSEHRGQGMGSYLIQSCLKSLKEKDIDKASLLVTGDNKGALELYRRLGFEEVDIDLVMTKRLD